MFTLNRTLINSKEMTSIVKSLNFYSFNHKFKLNKIFKIMNTLQIDFLIIQKSTKNLFKINMIKKIKKKKSKNYISAFNRVLTKTTTKRHRKNEIKKIDLIKQKKKFFEIKKFVVVVKKSDAKAIRDHKRIVRIEKKRLNEKMKIIKQIEVIDRKKKREKMKI